jgi:hypothetical protein
MLQIYMYRYTCIYMYIYTYIDAASYAFAYPTNMQTFPRVSGCRSFIRVHIYIYRFYICLYINHTHTHTHTHTHADMPALERQKLDSRSCCHVSWRTALFLWNAAKSTYHRRCVYRYVYRCCHVSWGAPHFCEMPQNGNTWCLYRYIYVSMCISMCIYRCCLLSWRTALFRKPHTKSKASWHAHTRSLGVRFTKGEGCIFIFIPSLIEGNTFLFRYSVSHNEGGVGRECKIY